LREKLGEVFHSSPELLEQLNPGVDLNGVAAGDVLQVPAVEPFHVSALPEGRYTSRGEVRRLVISVGGHFLHALDGAGNILYHFPSTLGADYSPSPEGEHLVESVHFHPAWHYQPALLPHVDEDDEDAVIAAGPNNDVGIVWMALSKPHYGIHGTRGPETIGYATSAGCVRLTNWDAAFLGRRVAEGTPVEFVHVDAEGR
jgi:lipoprotein-anchoring transpeptidase ErfK/SrfK